MGSISKNIFFSFLFFSLGICRAQTISDANAPVLKFETDTMNFGTVEWNSDGKRVMKFTNVGKSPLIISNSTGSCGCIVTEHPREPIMPGKSGFIKVHYDTKRPGPIHKYITISSNAKPFAKELKVLKTDEMGKVQTVSMTKTYQTGFPLIGKVLPPPPTEESFPAEKKTDGAIPFQKKN